MIIQELETGGYWPSFVRVDQLEKEKGKKKKKNLCLPALVFIFRGDKSYISSANKNLSPVISEAHIISI